MPVVTRFLLMSSSLRAAMLCAFTLAACSSGDKSAEHRKLAEKRDPVSRPPQIRNSTDARYGSLS